MAAISTTTVDFGKYTPALLEQLNASMSSGEKIKSGTRMVVIENTKNNQKTIKEYVKLSASHSNIKKACSLILTVKGDRPISMGSIEKPKVEGTIGNKGDMAEGVLGAAITARFLSKTKKITSADVLKILNSIKGTSTRKKYEAKSPTANKKINDDVIFHLSLAEKNMTSLLEKSTQNIMKGIIEASVNFANSKIVMEWADLLYKNNVQDKIEIIADGLSGQKTTKVDVFVQINGKLVDINVSLKAGDTKTFGQVGGAGFEKQVELWKSVLGFDVSGHENKFNNFLKQRKTIEALSSTYELASNHFNSKVRNKTQKKKILKSLADGILLHATRGEQNVILVQLDKSQATVYNFNSLHSILNSINLTSKIIKDTGGKPKMLIMDKKRKIFIQIRMKIENKRDGSVYVRNYIEKGKLMTELMSEVV